MHGSLVKVQYSNYLVWSGRHLHAVGLIYCRVACSRRRQTQAAMAGFIVRATALPVSPSGAASCLGLMHIPAGIEYNLLLNPESKLHKHALMAQQWKALQPHLGKPTSKESKRAARAAGKAAAALEADTDPALSLEWLELAFPTEVLDEEAA